MSIFDDHTDKILDGLRQPEWEKLTDDDPHRAMLRQDIGRMNLEIGDLRAEVARWKARAEAAEARLADYQNDYKFIMSERCWDENHCTCVPHLRRRIAELEAENAALRAMLHRLEWVDREDEYGGVHTECPVCHVWQFRGGHKPGCELEQVLRAGGEG